MLDVVADLVRREAGISQWSPTRCLSWRRVWSSVGFPSDVVSSPVRVGSQGAIETGQRVVKADDPMAKTGKEADVGAGSAAEVQDQCRGWESSPPEQFCEQGEPAPEATV